MCYFHHLNETFSHLKQSIFSAKVNAENLYSGWASNCLFVATLRKSKNVTKRKKQKSFGKNDKSEIKLLVRAQFPYPQNTF